MAFHTAQQLNVGNVKQWVSSYGTQWLGITNTGYVVSTTDESTWTKTLLQATPFATMAEKDGRVYAFVGNKVMYSDDNKTWLDGMTADAMGDTSLSFVNDRYIYMVQTDTRKLYRSYDGLNPARVYDLPPYINKIVSSEQGVLIATTSESGNIYRSIDNGATWTVIGLPLPDLNVSNEMSALGFVNGRFYVGFKAHSRIFVSTNELAERFEPVNVLVDNATNPLFFAFAEYDNHVVALGENEVYAFDRSDWKKIPVPTLKPVYTQANGQLFVASATSGRIIFSNNLSTWMVINSGTTRAITAIAANYNRTAMLGQASGYVHKYTIDVAPNELVEMTTAAATIEATAGADVIAREGQLDWFLFGINAGQVVKAHRLGTLVAKSNETFTQGQFQYPRYRIDGTTVVSEPARYITSANEIHGRIVILDRELRRIDTVIPYTAHILFMDVDHDSNLYVFYNDSTLIKYNRHLIEQWRVVLPYQAVCYKMRFDTSGRLYTKIYRHMVCIDTARGDIIYDYQTHNVDEKWAIDSNNGTVVTQTADGEHYTVSRITAIDRTGRVSWAQSLPLGQGMYAVVIDRTGRLFVHTTQGFTGITSRMDMLFYEHSIETGELLSTVRYTATTSDGFLDMFVDHENRLFGHKDGYFVELDRLTYQKMAVQRSTLVSGERSYVPRQVDRVDAFIYTDVIARLHAPQLKR